MVSLMGDAHYGPMLRQRGIEVFAINKPRGRVTLTGLLKLRRIIRAIDPDVVQTWMYHADLIGGLVARWAGVRGVVWGVRHSSVDAIGIAYSTRLTAHMCAFLSRWVPDAISCCSVRAAQYHQTIGYLERKFTVIPNGFDLSLFFPDEQKRDRTRREWGIGPDETLIGLVARWHDQKDHQTLLNSLSMLVDRHPHLRCVLVGSNMDRDNERLCAFVSKLGLSGRILLAGSRTDIPAVMNALDLHVLSSAYGEAFPNVVGEAMACGTPCVVTDVGDAAMIVGNTGWVVEPRDARALAKGKLTSVNRNC